MLRKLLLSALCAGSVGSAAAVEIFYLDNFTAWRNPGGNLQIQDFDLGPGSFAQDYGWAGKIFFSDGFNDGVPPPMYSNTGQNRYSVTGNFAGAEAGSRVEFSRDRAFTHAPAANGTVTQTQRMEYTTPLSINDGFAIGAVFDLATPSPTSRYGIRLSDPIGANTRAGYNNDNVDVRVSTKPAGNTVVEMFWQDSNLNLNSIIGSEAYLPPDSATQIWVMFLHSVVGDPTVSGYFRYFDEGKNMLEDWHHLGDVDLFRGETVTLGQAYARYTLNPIPEPGTAALLLAGLASVALVSRRRRRS